MASLNWVQLTNKLIPIPISNEIPLCSPIASVIVSLFALNSTLTPILTATGTLYLSSLRIVFIATPKPVSNEITSSLEDQSASITSRRSTKNSRLDSLSLPWSHFFDGKFEQPWFGPSFYRATVEPALDGGLDAPYIVKIVFKESGGAGFYSIAESMRDKAIGRRREDVEPLPLYTPPPPSTSTSTSSRAPTSRSNANPALPDQSNDSFEYDFDAIPLTAVRNSGALQQQQQHQDDLPGYYVHRDTGS